MNIRTNAASKITKHTFVLHIRVHISIVIYQLNKTGHIKNWTRRWRKSKGSTEDAKTSKRWQIDKTACYQIICLSRQKEKKNKMSINKSIKVYSIEYTYFPNAFFAALHTSLALLLLQCRHKANHTQIHFIWSEIIFASVLLKFKIFEIKLLDLTEVFVSHYVWNVVWWVVM
jgi:hypothetical protein